MRTHPPLGPAGQSFALGLRVLMLVLVASTAPAAAAQPAATPALRIVVLEGEDAVNIIQQRTAVAPVVEVRDRNDQPVAGAVVRFAIRSGRASFNGARTLTVTTNATGRAVAAGLSPSGPGALQIGATASYQGQAAAITIAQTNVATAAQAAAAGASAAGGGGTASAGGAAAGAAGGAAATGGAGTGAAAAGAAAGAAGGGISATTVGIIGAAIAGGSFAAKEIVGAATASTDIKGTYTAQFPLFYAPPPGAPLPPGSGCTVVWSLSGTIDYDYVEKNGTVQGDICDETDRTIVSSTCPQTVGTQVHTGFCFVASGSASSISGSGQRTNSAEGGNGTETYSFTGSMANGVLTGTFSESERANLRSGETATGSFSAPVTLR